MSRREPFTFSAPADGPSDGAKVFWRSLEEKSDPEAAARHAEAEFPLGLEEAKVSASRLVKLRRKGEESDPTPPLSRRGFMFFAGASAALFAEGCARRPVEKILPYSKAPEHVLPGVPSHYASVRPYRSDAIGMIVESHEGHPTKVEGNPDHPSSTGATDVWTQAEIYSLYDPDRSTAPMRGGRAMTAAAAKGAAPPPATWQEADAAIAEVVRAAQSDAGARLRLLVQPSTSPTFLRLRDAFQAKYPQAKIHVWAPVNEANHREGTKTAFGQPVNVVPLYSQARVIVSLDCDFLGTEAGSVRANREFSEGRKLRGGPMDPMSRLYVAEPSYTVTGMNADHHLRVAAQDVEAYLVMLARELADKHGVDLAAITDALGKAAPASVPAAVLAPWVAVVAKDVAAARGRSVFVAGTRQSKAVHALCAALNVALGNGGRTVNYYPVADATEQDPAGSLKALVADIERGQVSTLVIFGGNPAYDAPFDLRFAERVRAVTTSIHLSTHLDETSELCSWHIPRAHHLEAWGDFRALDGTVAIQQPLIAPLYGGRSDIEILARLAGEPIPKGHDLVQATTRGALSGAASMSRAWSDALRKGVLTPAARPLPSLEVRSADVATALREPKPGKAVGPDNLEVTFAPCPKIFDGRYANDPLLLELPDPITKASWDNVAVLSQATAAALGCANGQMVRLTREGAGPVDVAVWVSPGQADHSIALVLGWGRQKAGRYGNKHGFDVTPLRTSDALWMAGGVKVQKLGAAEIDAIRERYRRVGNIAAESPIAGRIRPDDPFDVDTQFYKISQTQEHHAMEGRPVAIDATLDQYRKNPVFPAYPDETRKDLDQHNRPEAVRGSGSPDPNVAPLWGNWKDESFFKNQHRWGMGIDLTACTGCNACVIACQVENNVPAVGKEQVWRGREMHWLRIDRYFVGLDSTNPQVVFQPVACVHCEEAPCENVCPVNATEHSPEGLNDMAYNRCIGTRYCANNCPYKVRRFNFLNYHTSGGAYEDVPEVEKMHYNPNVTVRMRGTMEKCTYCVQRIQEAKIKGKRTGQPLKDGDVVSACAQACPTEAIVFGDLADPNSKVAKWRNKDRAYRLLAELGTRPRTTYLGKVRNPNPEMGQA